MLDLLIVGAGPAGLSALMYAKLYTMGVLCIGDKRGGKLVTAPFIVDYPAIEGISGKEFIALLLSQVEKVKGELVEKRVDRVVIEQFSGERHFWIRTTENETYEAKTILLTTGNVNKQNDKSTNQIISGLQLEARNSLIVVDTHCKTNQAGVFAAGDGVIYPLSLEQLTTAVGTAITATAAVYEYLTAQKPPILWGNTKIPRSV